MSLSSNDGVIDITIDEEEPEENMSRCAECLRFVERADLEGHINSVHLKYYPYHCYVCDATLPSRQHLDVHAETEAHFQTNGSILQGATPNSFQLRMMPQRVLALKHHKLFVRSTINISASPKKKLSDLNSSGSGLSVRTESSASETMVTPTRFIDNMKDEQTRINISQVGESETEKNTQNNSARKLVIMSLKNQNEPSTLRAIQTQSMAVSNATRVDCSHQGSNRRNDRTPSLSRSRSPKFQITSAAPRMSTASSVETEKRRKLKRRRSSPSSSPMKCQLCSKQISHQQMSSHLVTHLAAKGIFRYSCKFPNCEKKFEEIDSATSAHMLYAHQKMAALVIGMDVEDQSKEFLTEISMMGSECFPESVGKHITAVMGPDVPAEHENVHNDSLPSKT